MYDWFERKYEADDISPTQQKSPKARVVCQCLALEKKIYLAHKTTLSDSQDSGVREKSL